MQLDETIRGEFDRVDAAVTAKEDEVVTTHAELINRFGFKHRRSCINTIRRDFPNILLDLSGVNFEAMYGADIVPSYVLDLTDLPPDKDISGEEKVTFKEKDNME